MNLDVIREAVRRRPFQPFTLRMNDGREFHVPHPELAAVSRRVVIVMSPPDEVGVWLEPVLIASLHYDTQADGSASEPHTGGNP
jgi:hypothetical protein